MSHSNCIQGARSSNSVLEDYVTGRLAEMAQLQRDKPHCKNVSRFEEACIPCSSTSHSLYSIDEENSDQGNTGATVGDRSDQQQKEDAFTITFPKQKCNCNNITMGHKCLIKRLHFGVNTRVLLQIAVSADRKLRPYSDPQLFLQEQCNSSRFFRV